MHPSHVTPDPKNIKADRTLTIARVIRDRLKGGDRIEAIREQLVPHYLEADEFHLSWKAALVLLK